jgi:hypothetical protein
LPGAIVSLWQSRHRVGSAWKFPFVWQLSQLTDLCAPSSGKPVEK